MAMYIRVKRKKSTYFVDCDPSETTLQVKAKLQNLTSNPIRNQRLILLSSYQVLDDTRTLAQQKVENDVVVAMTLKKGNGQWEDIDIDNSSHCNDDSSDSG